MGPMSDRPRAGKKTARLPRAVVGRERVERTEHEKPTAKLPRIEGAAEEVVEAPKKRKDPRREE